MDFTCNSLSDTINNNSDTELDNISICTDVSSDIEINDNDIINKDIITENITKKDIIKKDIIKKDIENKYIINKYIDEYKDNNNKNGLFTTEGYDNDNIYKRHRKENAQCQMCGKYYLIDMFIDIQCKHCFFFMNYDNHDIIDGLYGITVFDYIIQCKNKHKSPCIKLSNGECNCYLCAYNLKIPIEGVVNKKIKKSIDKKLLISIHNNKNSIDKNTIENMNKIILNL